MSQDSENSDLVLTGKLTAKANVLTPGKHGFHFHTVSSDDCGKVEAHYNPLMVLPACT